MLYIAPADNLCRLYASRAQLLKAPNTKIDFSIRPLGRGIS